MSVVQAMHRLPHRRQQALTRPALSGTTAANRSSLHSTQAYPDQWRRRTDSAPCCLPAGDLSVANRRGKTSFALHTIRLFRSNRRMKFVNANCQFKLLEGVFNTGCASTWLWHIRNFKSRLPVMLVSGLTEECRVWGLWSLF